MVDVLSSKFYRIMNKLFTSKLCFLSFEFLSHPDLFCLSSEVFYQSVIHAGNLFIDYKSDKLFWIFKYSDCRYMYWPKTEEI